ncbi:uncharacterized protein LOC123672632 isoform X2 [Harmonia axyridis]|nr:uncharacterized protein LOC123672632 isoform X2 [Harmonia axyridis]
MIKVLLLSSLLLHYSLQSVLQLGRHGKLGVNFMGFKAGLDFANGGLKSYAETPFGQKATAGFQRNTGLFAGADSGVKNYFAMAGLGGKTVGAFGNPVSPYERITADWG